MSETVLIPCRNCGAQNRVPRDKLHPRLRPVCGRCKNPLVLDAAPVIVTDATFAAEVESSALPVLLDAWAPWCGPCRVVAPVLEELAVEWTGRLKIAKLNVDDNPRTASRFVIQSIPSLLLFQNGREIDRIVGAHPKSDITRRLERALA